MKRLRFGILGSGFMGRTHAEAVRRLPDTAELIAVAGGSRAPGLAERYGMACEPDAAALLRRTDIDAVVITTPHALHVEEGLASLRSGRHILVEKPLTTSVADCDRLMEAAAQNKLTLATGYQQRFRVNNARALELIQAGTIGRVLAVQVSMPMYAGAIKAGGFGGNWAWWNDPASVGHLINSSPHAIDLLRGFTGGDVVTVSAFSRTFLPDLTVEDTTMGMLEFSSGRSAPSSPVGRCRRLRFRARIFASASRARPGCSTWIRTASCAVGRGGLARGLPTTAGQTRGCGHGVCRCAHAGLPGPDGGLH
jgi:UDP-N-acetyl-2-amino-2-deoxyglucuronate dehydrogenase